MRSTNYDERNIKLANYDGRPGCHGRLRLLRQGLEACIAKEKQEFHCLDCRAGRDGGWWMLIHNVKSGKGCPICASSNDLISQASAKWPDYRLVMLPTTKGMPQLNDIRYQMVPKNNPLPDSVAWSFTPLMRATITQGLRLSERPGRDQDASYNTVVNVHRRWTEVFGSEASIIYACKKKPGSTSPGPFFTIHALQRCMRSPITQPYIAAAGVLAICEQECKDRIKDASWRLNAQSFGATIIGYEHTNATGVKIRYKNRFELDRLDTYQRAVETNWGQTKMRKGESLCAIILGLLFPSDDWRSNSRPLFLTYAVANTAPSRLELDGYSDALKLAFEYQGDHHYNARDDTTGAALTLVEIQARDSFKAKVCADCKITLFVIPEMNLDPEGFLEYILDICTGHGRFPSAPHVSLDAVWEKWNAWCENPLAEFQDKVIAQLSLHRLLSPMKEKIGKKTLVRYECNHCGKENEAIAKSLKEGPVRQGCPSCKSEISGENRREALLGFWHDSYGLPAVFIDNLRANSAKGETRYVCEQDTSHVVVVHNIAFAQRHIINGSFVCPECETINLGVDASRVAQQRQWNMELTEDLKALGLSVIKLKPPQNGQTTALVSCSSGKHKFEVTRSEASAMLRNECINDREIVPSACHKCCYPVKDVTSTLMRSTVFHRLYVLGGMYPRVSYIEGFDPKGWKEEFYACGNAHADGTPHSPIRVSFRNMQKAARRYPTTHLCVACGLEKGQIVGGGKTLDDLVALMHVMRDEIARHVQLPVGLTRPTVQFLSGQMSDKGEVSTTKAYLRFFCGVPKHATFDGKKDYYFHRAESRGAGFCRECVKLLGKTKAPIPKLENGGGALRKCAMRDDESGQSALDSAPSSLHFN